MLDTLHIQAQARRTGACDTATHQQVPCGQELAESEFGRTCILWLPVHSFTPRKLGWLDI